MMRRVRRTVSFAGLSKKSQIKHCGLSSSPDPESGKCYVSNAHARKDYDI